MGSCPDTDIDPTILDKMIAWNTIFLFCVFCLILCFANCIFLHAGFSQSVCNIQTPEEAAKLIGEFFLV